ncbi:hypothetical protein [Ruminococcus sp.]|uniref:hypothetical protein n=1 Tax=Ruminococcus sp. TaxID=41978 RepID=UPI0025FDFB10|nr:hypothetical protein [Ruminococcus sp.]
MSRTKKHNDKIILALVLVMFFLVLPYLFALKIQQRAKFREKTTFTAQETKILWSDLGLEYVDLDISKAYFNGSLCVVSEEFDSIDSEIEYLKQFKGNENVHKDDYPSTKTLRTDHKEHEAYEIHDIAYDIDADPKNLTIECYTYNVDGKYRLEFYKIDAGRNKDYDLYEMFGLKTNNSDG